MDDSDRAREADIIIYTTAMYGKCMGLGLEPFIRNTASPPMRAYHAAGWCWFGVSLSLLPFCIWGFWLADPTKALEECPEERPEERPEELT
jgi:hypothetical protein